MKFYVATKFENKYQAQVMMALLEHLGHEVTYNWTHHYKGDGLEPFEHAANDMQGVREADALVLLCYPGLLGTYIEMGAALGLGKTVYMIGEPHKHTIFHNHPLVVECRGVEDFLRVLGRKDENLLCMAS